MTSDDESHCYPVKIPSAAHAYRILGLAPPETRTIKGVTYEAASEESGPAAILCGKIGPPCFHCGGVSDALCDFPVGEENRTCDRALCLGCAPNVGFDGLAVPLQRQTPEADYKNYCHDHDEHGRKMLLFPQEKRVLEPGTAPRKRAKPLPKKPPESHRWRVRQGAHGHPPGAVLTGWMTQIEAKLFANKVGGYVETWDEFVKLWRTLYPLKEQLMANERIPVLWFDSKGCGPDEFALELHHFPSELDGRIPAFLGIRVRAGDIVIQGGPMVDGGFNLHYTQVAELHAQLGKWLEENK